MYFNWILSFHTSTFSVFFDNPNIFSKIYPLCKKKRKIHVFLGISYLFLSGVIVRRHSSRVSYSSFFSISFKIFVFYRFCCWILSFFVAGYYFPECIRNVFFHGKFGIYYCRLKDEISPFRAKLGNCLSDLVDSTVSTVQGSVRDVKAHTFWGSNPIFDGTYSVVVCFKSFLSCPIFIDDGKEDTIDPGLRRSIVLCIERLLKAFSSLYLEFSNCDRNLQSETVNSEVSGYSSSDDKPFSLGGSKSKLIDMDLDVAADSSDVIDGTTGAGNFLSGSRLKVDTLSLIAGCFSVLPIATWDILFDILSTENDYKVSCFLQIIQFKSCGISSTLNNYVKFILLLFCMLWAGMWKYFAQTLPESSLVFSNEAD